MGQCSSWVRGLNIEPLHSSSPWNETLTQNRRQEPHATKLTLCFESSGEDDGETLSPCTLQYDCPSLWHAGAEALSGLFRFRLSIAHPFVELSRSSG